MNIYILIKESRYKAVHDSNHKHLGHTVISSTFLPPQHMPKLNSWMHDNLMNVKGYECKFTLHKTVFEP